MESIEKNDAGTGSASHSTDSGDAGGRLRLLRSTLGYSQRDLAREFGASVGAISQWESGKRPVPGTVLRLMEIYESDLGMTGLAGGRSMRTNWVSRTLNGTLTGAGIAMRMATGNLRQLVAGHERAAAIRQGTALAIRRKIHQELGSEKGLMLKFAQQMAMAGSDLPLEVRREISRILEGAPRMDPATVQRFFICRFNRKPADLFREWEDHAFAAASIGQVHRARTVDGRRVAVKIQYEGITSAIGADLKNLSGLMRVWGTFFRYQPTKAIVAELKEIFTAELDYEREAQHTLAFRDIFAGTPRVRVPDVLRDYSGPDILTTEYLDGLPLDKWALNANSEERNRIGRLLFSVVLYTTFRAGLINGDPSPGNYLVDGDNLGLVDFGCVQRLDPHVQKGFLNLLKATTAGDPERMKKGLISIGFVPRPDKMDMDQLLNQWWLPLNRIWLEDRTFRATRQNIIPEGHLQPDQVTRLGFPKGSFFLIRLWEGMLLNLINLEAEANWHRLFHSIMASRSRNPVIPAD